MTIGANSYGSVASVAAITPEYVNDSGTYDGTTTPTLTQVEGFIDEVGGVLNVILAKAGFSIPVTQADAKKALDHFSNTQAAQLVHAANGSGPYAPGSDEMRARSPFQVITKEAEGFIGGHALGFERLGATRTYKMSDGLQSRKQDDAGDDIEPIFQRKSMGNELTDWDTP